MNTKGLHEFSHAGLFFCLFYAGLHESLPAKTPRQALKSGHCCQPLDPFCAPVCLAMRGFGLAGHSAGCVALVFSCLFEGIGIAATAAFHSIELSACRQLFAFMATGQMPVNVEMDNHELSPLRRVLHLTTCLLCRSAMGRRQKNTRMRAGERGVLQRSDFTVDAQM
jgi:hypothetical protein